MFISTKNPNMDFHFNKVCFQLCYAFLFVITIRFFLTISRCFKNKKQSKVLVDWPVIGAFPSFLSNAHRLHEWTVDISNTIGMTIVRKVPFDGSIILYTCDPRNVEYMVKTNFSNFHKGLDFQETMELLGRAIFTVDDDEWHAQRKMANTIFSPKDFRGFTASVTEKEVHGSLIPCLSNAAKTSSVIDMQHILLRFTFDSIFTVMFGKSSNDFATHDVVNKFANAIDDVGESLIFRVILPAAWWKLGRFLNVGNERMLAKSSKIVEEFMQQCISLKREELLKGGQEANDVIATYMTSKEVGRLAVQPIDDKFLQDTAFNLLFAGRDTTAISLSWFFWLVATTPRVEAKILEELNRVVVKGTTPFVFDSKDLKGLVYLHAALCESLRLYPSLPINKKGVQRDDVLPDGTKVKPGMKVLFSMYAMGRMETVWGKDCLEFRPERWIEDNGTISHKAISNFFSFNTGPRTCIGKDMAFTQMKVVVSAVLFNFKFEPVEGHIVSPRPAATLQMKNGLLIRVKERKHLLVS